MECPTTKETLEKQLQLLSGRSENAVDGHELTEITYAMVRLAEVLRSFS